MLTLGRCSWSLFLLAYACMMTQKAMVLTLRTGFDQRNGKRTGRGPAGRGVSRKCMAKYHAPPLARQLSWTAQASRTFRTARPGAEEPEEQAWEEQCVFVLARRGRRQFLVLFSFSACPDTTTMICLAQMQLRSQLHLVLRLHNIQLKRCWLACVLRTRTVFRRRSSMSLGYGHLKQKRLRVLVSQFLVGLVM